MELNEEKLNELVGKVVTEIGAATNGFVNAFGRQVGP